MRAYSQEEGEVERFRSANEEYVRRNRQLIRLQGFFYPSMTFFLGLGALLDLWLGGQAVIRRRISLGEFFAMVPSFEQLATYADNKGAQVLADSLDKATGTFLENDKSPTRRVGGIDNRGSHFYLGLYWAQEIAAQTVDADLAAVFKPFAESLAASEETIVAELNGVQGHPADIGGYYRPDDAKADTVMRPSATLNAALAAL